MYQSDYCSVSYIKKENLILVTWKNACSGEDYRQPVSCIVDLFAANPICSKLLIDARNGFEDDPADIEWGFTVFLPALSHTNCKDVYFLMHEVSTIEEEMGLWAEEFQKYFNVYRIASYSDALCPSICKNSFEIHYKQTKDIAPAMLAPLFKSVDWASGDYPDKLASAILNFGCVITAWHGEQLVGLAAAMDDTVMTAYIHYLLVNPAYQKQGIGQHLIKQLLEHYKDFLKIALISVPEQVHFYKKCGFSAGEGYVPMSITSLRN